MLNPRNATRRTFKSNNVLTWAFACALGCMLGAFSHTALLLGVLVLGIYSAQGLRAHWSGKLLFRDLVIVAGCGTVLAVAWAPAGKLDVINAFNALWLYIAGFILFFVGRYAWQKIRQRWQPAGH